MLHTYSGLRPHKVPDASGSKGLGEREAMKYQSWKLEKFLHWPLQKMAISAASIPVCAGLLGCHSWLSQIAGMNWHSHLGDQAADSSAVLLHLLMFKMDRGKGREKVKATSRDVPAKMKNSLVAYFQHTMWRRTFVSLHVLALNSVVPQVHSFISSV